MRMFMQVCLVLGAALLLLLTTCSAEIKVADKKSPFTALELMNFVHYHYYFHSSQSQAEESWLTCSSNHTEYILTSRLQKCPSPTFFPRVVENSQISWKSVKKPRRGEAKKNATATATAGGESSSRQDHGAIDNDEEAEDARTVVHEYMAFALVLPQHPFSAELIHTLRVVAPMFPLVHTVVGVGYEFRGMCTQYGVTAFPQVLLFSKGFLRSKLTHRAAANISDLTIEFAAWTKSFPISFPNIPEPIRRQSLPSALAPSNNFFSRTLFQHGRLFGCSGRESGLCEMLTKGAQYLDNVRNRLLQRVVLRHSLEPVMATLESAVDWDRYGYFWVTSGLYVFLRAVYLLTRIRRQPVTL